MQTTRRIISSFTIGAALAAYAHRLRRDGNASAVETRLGGGQPIVKYDGGNQRKLSVPMAGGGSRKKRRRYVDGCSKNVKGLFPKEKTERDMRYLALAEEKRTRRYPHRAVIRSLGIPLGNL